MVVIDNAVYLRGTQIASPATLDATYEVLHEQGGMAWIGLQQPDAAELHSLAAEFGLHELMIEDALTGHQRPKIERYGDTLFAVFKGARYLDAEERVEFGEIHVIIGNDFAITIRHAQIPDIVAVRKRLEADTELLAMGPEAVLYGVLDEIVDRYRAVIAGLENDIDQIEDTLFDEGQESSERIYTLSREVIQFQRATQPLVGILEALGVSSDQDSTDQDSTDTRGAGAAGRTEGNQYAVSLELRRYLRDVQDHVLRIVERADGFKTLLENALSVNTALVGERQNDVALTQNEQMKKISSWAAIFFAPSLIAGIYGMNFTHMPALDWAWGFLFSLVLMIGGAVVLYVIFKKNKWL